MVAERVVVVAVRVDHRADRLRAELAEVGQDLVRLAMADPRVDDQEPVVAADRDDVLVVERVAPDVDPVADLGPDAHVAQRSGRRAYDARRDDRFRHDDDPGS